MKRTVTAPETFFGFKPGADRKMIRWDRMVEYFKLLASESDRIAVENMGPTTEGNDFIKVTVTSPENFKILDELKKISMTIADPRGLSEEEIEGLIKRGKAVSVHSMSLHADEIGPTQATPEIAYKLCSCESEENLRILENVVFVMVPCFNPDGQIKYTDWYNETLGTDYEGYYYPKLFHTYAGHDNNRDALAQNLVESRYMADIVFHEWMPQAYQDYHHMGSYGARMAIAPYTDPIRPYADPLVWRELSWYGNSMAYRMDSEGLDGIITGAIYPGWGHTGFHYITPCHNIAGMLSESAKANLATPKYIHPSQLRGDQYIVMPGGMAGPYKYEAKANFPSPWPGGWWRLGDITERVFWAAYSLLDTMARNRETILRNMVTKALRQTKKGEESEEYAFIISSGQHDEGVTEQLIDILLGQNIEVHEAKSAFKAGDIVYDAGTRVVFLAQPKYGMIMNMLGRTDYPDNQLTRSGSGALMSYDVLAQAYPEIMSVNVIPAKSRFNGDFAKISSSSRFIPEIGTYAGYVLSGRENSSYHTVNLLLKAGLKVYRLNDRPHKDFYVEADAGAINEILAEAPTKIWPVCAPCENRSEIKPARVALYQRYYAGNANEGWTRFLFDRDAFPYETVYDKDIFEGKLKNYDLLIIPSDGPRMLTGPKNIPGTPKDWWIGDMPPEYQSGLGKEGAAAIKRFVEEGGRLAAIEHAANYTIDILGLSVRNIVRDLPRTQFGSYGSSLRVNIENQEPPAYGMPGESAVLHCNGPVFDITDDVSAEKYNIFMSFAKKDILKCGSLTGESLIAGKALALTVKHKAGEVVLYGFSPQWRAQSCGTFKLLYNTLYL